MKNIAIFASGSGSNAENIAHYFENQKDLNIECIFSNNKDAYVLERAKKLNIPSCTFSRDDFYNSDVILDKLKKSNIDMIVLAGFLWLMPEKIIKAFKIVNIHPALLPKHGGKGMYGDRVHKAVVADKDTESGITIHFIDENYDQGKTIFQAKCPVLPTDTAEDVAAKVHKLEYEHFPRVIVEVLRSL